MLHVRRCLVAPAAVLFAFHASFLHAGGFAIVSQSGSGIANALAGGAAAAEDATTVWYNPAGMSELDGTRLSVVANVIDTSFKFRNTASSGAFALPGTGEGGDGGGLSLVPQAYLTHRVNERWTAGLALNTPFGLKTEYDAGWRGQLVALKSQVTAYNVNPSVAYRVNDALSVAAGLNWQYFETELTNFAGALLGTATLKAHDSGWGYNVGALLKVTDATRVGVAYRSAIAYTLNGNATFSGAGGAANSGARADLTVPESAAFSVFSTLSSRWDVMAGATWTRWSSVQSVDVVRTSASILGGPGSLVNSLPFRWRDTIQVGVGANYKPAADWKIRFGLGYDPAASNDATRTPRLPDQSRLMLAVGVRHDLTRRSALNVSFIHERIKDANVNDTVAGAPGALVGTFRNHADALTLQLDHRFY